MPAVDLLGAKVAVDETAKLDALKPTALGVAILDELKQLTPDVVGADRESAAP